MMRPLSFRTLALFGCLALSPLALAQQQATSDQPIQQQMSAVEFRAAGLDKLDAEELASLNRWLGRKIEAETALAAAAAKKKVEDENRGFLSFGSEEPVVGTVTSEFRGFGKGRRYTLDNGQVWEQVDSASLVGVRNRNPQVTIRPSVVGTAWYMSVEGYNTRAKVKRVE
ncbi:hypothetical protein FKV24_013540 [Lysobacter maris]|uniref:Uncharacterized protein n=1 Tax=Marilutibacter maris TaxID=1605891 RepID=A0A508ADJ7_9GAMM|nr:hypothetical protein [Lysobacter maris]KAB8175423.1 hypothetical protein FKV24_013540 [Lysobacter maris]